LFALSVDVVVENRVRKGGAWVSRPASGKQG